MEGLTVDVSDIREITDFSKARKNPYAERIREHGFSVTVHYSPEDVSKMMESGCEPSVDLLELDPEELQALARYRAAKRLGRG
jgi:hypothetical protein